MATKADIESFLLKCEVDSEEVDFGTWLVRDVEGHGARLVVRIEEPIVVFRAEIMELPADGGLEPFLRRLLELNASEMVHAAFGLDGRVVVVGGALALENLDFNEFQALLDDVTLAISTHKQTLVAGPEPAAKS